MPGAVPADAALFEQFPTREGTPPQGGGSTARAMLGTSLLASTEAIAPDAERMKTTLESFWKDAKAVFEKN